MCPNYENCGMIVKTCVIKQLNKGYLNSLDEIVLLKETIDFVKLDLIDLSESKLTKWMRLLVDRSLLKINKTKYSASCIAEEINEIF